MGEDDGKKIDVSGDLAKINAARGAGITSDMIPAGIPANKLAQHLEKMGYVDKPLILDILTKRFGVSAIDLDEFKDIPPEVVQRVSLQLATKYKVMPISRVGNTLVVAMVDPSNIIAIDDIKFCSGINVEAVPAISEAIDRAIERYYGAADDEPIDDSIFEDATQDLEVIDLEANDNLPDSELSIAAQQKPVVRIVNMIIDDAVRRGASDIHLEIYDKTTDVRFRVDGILHSVMKPPFKVYPAIVSRIKIMAKLRIDERRMPQDGRIRLKTAKGKEIDFRVSVIPTIYGEKVVLRLLDRDSLQLDMTKLGFEVGPLKKFQEAILQPHGIILVTGPTGSGKTTTLYSALAELNKRTQNISTVEDPVEYTLRGINQVQMNEAVGLTFAGALRSFLRQDPDIIMVGEIRDFETAEIAVKAALTGHLVLSTLHTNDAPSSVTRLLQMGIEPFLVVSSLRLIAAQRLVRKICTSCQEEIEVSHQLLQDLQVRDEQIEQLKAFRGVGCNKCNKTGYRGRIAVYEVMPMTEEIQEFVLNGASPFEIKREAIRLGMQTMRQAAINKLAEGVTTIEEIIRVTAKD